MSATADLPPAATPPDELVRRADAASARLREARRAIDGVIFGQEEVVEQTLTALLAGGHTLLIGAPGLGKTLLVATLGRVLGLDARRVQFTPDLMPADIIGSEVLDEDPVERGGSGQRRFRFVPGPIFTQFLLADEINRASPRTQSALLQAMGEGRVAVAGHDHALPQPFHVLATQNPLEQEGTYPLPEAQLDRFLLQVDLGYPEERDERAMLIATTGAPRPEPAAVMSAAALREAQDLVRMLPVGEAVVDAILRLVRGARPEMAADKALAKQLAWGPGPRAAQALMLATRARALLGGRLAPSLDDVAALAAPVLRHRMALTFGARAEGVTLPELIGRLVGRLG